MRTAIAVLSFLLFGQTVLWLGYDVFDLGISGAWSAWTSGSEGSLSATSPLDLGLAALQLAAGCAVLRAARGAGGLLVTASAVTMAIRLPTVWYVLLDSSSDPWFGTRPGPSVVVVGGTGIAAFLVAAALGALLLLVRHLENEEAAAADELSGTGIRPMKVTASASGVLLAVLNVFYIGRNAHSVVRTENDIWLHRLFGKGSTTSVLGVSQSWQWASLTILCGIGMFLAARRRPIAPGVSLGLSYFMMPPAVTSIWSAIESGTFPGAVGSLQNLLELLGSAAVLALVFRETRFLRRSVHRMPIREGTAPYAPGRDLSSGAGPAPEVRVHSGEV